MKAKLFFSFFLFSAIVCTMQGADSPNLPPIPSGSSSSSFNKINTARSISAIQQEHGLLAVMAAREGNFQRLALIFGIIPPHDQNALHEAAIGGHIECVRYLLYLGVRPRSDTIDAIIKSCQRITAPHLVSIKQQRHHKVLWLFLLSHGLQSYFMMNEVYTLHGY